MAAARSVAGGKALGPAARGRGAQRLARLRQARAGGMSGESYGRRRLKLVFQPVEGKALPMKAGEVLRITQLGNRQCVDFNCYNLHDNKEQMAGGFPPKPTFRPNQ